MAKPRILIAWEAGANYGHVAKISAIATALGSRAEVTVALRDPVAFRTLAPNLPVRLLPSPLPPYDASQPTGWNYADNLRHLGYVSSDAIAALIESWRNLFTLTKPDLLITEAAPTALLASRGMRFKTLHVGSGFEIPPMTDPMPAFLHWSDQNKDRTVAGEREVLGWINGALPRFKVEPLNRVADTLEADGQALLTIPELDHYPTEIRHADTEYFGSLYNQTAGIRATWLDAHPKIFAYLYGHTSGGVATIEALGSLGKELDIILASPGLDRKIVEQITAQGVQVFDKPVRLDGLLEECSLGINHASMGTSVAFALAGIPQIGIPSQIEQMMMSYAIGKNGLGIGLNGKASARDMRGIILQTLEANKMRLAALALRQKYQAQTPSLVAERIAALALSFVK